MTRARDEIGAGTDKDLLGSPQMDLPQFSQPDRLLTTPALGLVDDELDLTGDRRNREVALKVQFDFGQEVEVVAIGDRNVRNNFVVGTPVRGPVWKAVARASVMATKGEEGSGAR
jgi:hypothetical protein